jgi:metal-responsive CopG/Arc/MetJ family transcriptional regulator
MSNSAYLFWENSMTIGAIKRIGISIPDSVLKDLRILIPERKRSEYIVKALREKIEEEKKRKLHEKMIAGYRVNMAADAETAEAWRSLEEEADLLISVREPKKAYGRKPSGVSKKR